MIRALLLVLVLAALFLSSTSAAAALPVYAHEYGFSCEQCHSIVPHLNAFGEDFLRAGFRLPPSIAARRTFPLAVKVNLAYTSQPDAGHLPKAMVDELELLAGAPITKHVSYRVEQYAMDGGVPGNTRDAWLQFTSVPEFGSRAAALRVTVGEFTLPLPVDPETQRDTLNHYALFDQSVGNNPFNLFDDRIGVDVAYGAQGQGASVHVLALKGHDPQSGLPSDGLDRMIVAQNGTRIDMLTAYRYDGSRPLGARDRFWREAFGLTHRAGLGTFDFVLQTGGDSNAAPRASAVHSSGGFAQIRWAWSADVVGDLRFDRTSDSLSGGKDALTAALIFRPRRNAR
ncbi:MAG TPA: hypothetical protein VJN22_02045, partial [Candidatus Eremiobacteraceae bacterium]|nr:hypothetical protein [Candidatus Eremiobacteraceae bacterium]